ncbi:MAG: DUF5673 domain-containing protein [Halothermotrichaceae bacterium]
MNITEWIFLILPTVIIVIALNKISKMKKWDNIHYSKSIKQSKYLKYSLYIIIIISVVNITYYTVQGVFTFKILKFPILIIAAVLYIYISYNYKFKITEHGIVYTDNFFEWDAIESYEWDKDTLILNLKGKKIPRSLINLDLGEEDKEKVESLIKDRIG